MSKKTKSFMSLANAQAFRDEMNVKYSTPEFYSQADLDNGTLKQVGGGIHVPVTELVKRQQPKIYISPTGLSWCVEASNDMLADAEVLALLTDKDLSDWSLVVE